MKFSSADMDGIKGFLDHEEGLCLYELAVKAAPLGPCLEIGSYCGRSTAYIGQACREQGGILFSVDHHRGSEEQQPGEDFFDPALFDFSSYRVDTFRHFQKTLEDFSLSDTVVPIVAKSETVGRMWATPLAFIFIDGGHAYETVLMDYNVWYGHLLPGGYLIFHDIFQDPSQGGQAPRMVYEKALKSGRYKAMPMVGTLGILKRF